MNITLLHWMVDATVRASILTAAVLLLQGGLRGVISARCRYALWLPVLLVLTLPVLPRSRWSAENFFVARVPARAPVSLPVQVQIGDEGAAATAVSNVSTRDWKAEVAFIIWAAGVGLSLGGGLFLYAATLRRFVLQAQEPDEALMKMIGGLCSELRLGRTPRVIVSRAVESPAVTGLLRPVLLLPADFAVAFAGKEARLVLKHELMHIKRLDLPINALVSVLNAVHWFNPVLWLATWCARQDREAACDAQVLASEPRDCRSDYGNVLLKVQTGDCQRWLSIGFVGIFEAGRALRGRVEAVARYRRPGPASGIVAGAAILLLGVLGATHAQTNEVAPAQAPGAAGAAGAPAQDFTLPGEENTNGLVTKEYRLLPTFAAQLGKGRTAAMDFLTSRGVTLPGGANVMYFPSTRRLIVHDTPANIQLADAALKDFIAAAIGDTRTQYIRNKLDSIIIPKIEFRDTSLREAVDFVKQKSVELDASTSDPAQRGVNIVLQLSGTGTVPGDKITVSLTNKSLASVLQSICQAANVKMKVDPYAVSLAPPDVNVDELITKEYKVPADFLSSPPRQSVMDYLNANGVQFPKGASAVYFATGHRLIVHNTAPNIELVDAIVDGLGRADAPNGSSSPSPSADSPAPGSIQDKLNHIIIPHINFRDATLSEAVDYLKKQSVEHDTRESDPTKRGVNIVLTGPAPNLPGATVSLNGTGRALTVNQNVNTTYAGVLNGVGVFTMSGNGTLTLSGARITLSITNLPLIEAIKYVAQLANYKCTIEANRVVLSPP